MKKGNDCIIKLLQKTSLGLLGPFPPKTLKERMYKNVVRPKWFQIFEFCFLCNFIVIL